MTKKPTSFDYNIITIGAGSAGLVSGYIASAIKAKVCLIEKNEMGGDCLNTGCVPSKALIASAQAMYEINNADNHGIYTKNNSLNFKRTMQRVHDIISKIAPHDSVERYEKLGVEVIKGEARIIDKYRVEVNSKTLTARNIIIATGATPVIPAIEDIEKANYVTSDTIWNLKELPKKFVVLGGGAIGCEMAQAFSRLGSDVTIIQRGDRILNFEDSDVGKVIEESFIEEGINILTSHEAKAIEIKDKKQFIVCESNNKKEKIEFDTLLVAVGRKPNLEGFGLENLNLKTDDNGNPEIDEYMRGSEKNIFFCGDVSDNYQFTHTASHQAWYASVNALFGVFKKFKVDYQVIPWTIFTAPEVAHVGINEVEAKEKGVDFEVTKYHIDDLDRAIASGKTKGFVKVLTKRGGDKILGATIVSENAGNMLAEFNFAMKHKIGLKGILKTIHVYPTFVEANKNLAGKWQQKHIPNWAIYLSKKFNKWMRR